MLIPTVYGKEAPPSYTQNATNKKNHIKPISHCYQDSSCNLCLIANPFIYVQQFKLLSEVVSYFQDSQSPWLKLEYASGSAWNPYYDNTLNKLEQV